MKPRHYVLLALLVAVAVFQYARRHRYIATTTTDAPTPVTTAPAAPESTAAAKAWADYDAAARDRDAAADVFTPALNSFDASRSQVTAQPGLYAAQDLDACRLWLMQYRGNGQMKSMAAHHVDSCARLHRDVAQ